MNELTAVSLLFLYFSSNLSSNSNTVECQLHQHLPPPVLSVRVRVRVWVRVWVLAVRRQSFSAGTARRHASPPSAACSTTRRGTPASTRTAARTAPRACAPPTTSASTCAARTRAGSASTASAAASSASPYRGSRRTCRSVGRHRQLWQRPHHRQCRQHRLVEHREQGETL